MQDLGRRFGDGNGSKTLPQVFAPESEGSVYTAEP